MKIKHSVIVTGGGTGGHLSIAKSLIDELEYQNQDIIYIGSSNGYDKDWFEGYSKIKESFFFDTKGVVNKGVVGKVVSLAQIFKATIEVIKMIKEKNIKFVVSVGGYSAAAASFASIVTKIPLFIHEQNAHIGKLNQLLKPKAMFFYSSFDEQSPIKDYPVDKRFFDKARDRTEVKSVIFLGGSQGAVAINNFALTVAKYLSENNIHIIHQTGKNDFLRVSREYKAMEIDVDVFDFCNHIEERFAQADVAISRSGASTMWELVANRLPTIFIPYPYAASDHQYQNAKFLEDEKLCFLFREEEFESDEDYINVLEEFIAKDMQKISQQLSKKIAPDGVKQIVNHILKHR